MTSKRKERRNSRQARTQWMTSQTHHQAKTLSYHIALISHTYPTVTHTPCSSWQAKTHPTNLAVLGHDQGETHLLAYLDVQQLAHTASQTRAGQHKARNAWTGVGLPQETAGRGVSAGKVRVNVHIRSYVTECNAQI